MHQWLQSLQGKHASKVPGESIAGTEGVGCRNTCGLCPYGHLVYNGADVKRTP